MNPIDLAQIARAAMRERGLEPEIGAAAAEQARALGAAPPALDAGLVDLRHLAWCSIDNDDSRDLDQLSVMAEGDPARVLIAVADVDRLVVPGSPIDAHARANTTSVYTDAGVFPMLPLELSTDLSSLNEGVERAAIVIEIEVSAAGAEPSAPHLYRALVRNQAQLTYDAVAAWLDGSAPMPPRVAAVAGLEAQLRAQDRAGAALVDAGRRRGALDLATPEPRPAFGRDGVLIDLRVEAPSNRAKDLIAAFMVAANGVVARFLDAAGSPSLRRFLREPARWQKIVEIAAGYGEALPAAPDAVALDAFLARRKLAAPDRFAELSLTIVKLLGSGEYIAARPGEHGTGHFGLAVTDYTHSTAPNRRYPDLVTQRLAEGRARRGAVAVLDDTELMELAAPVHRSRRTPPRKVERQVRKSSVAFLLAPRIGDWFDGIVTGVNARGTWVRIVHPVAEGRVVQGQDGLDVGDRTRVELVGVDATRGFIDFVKAVG